ncbi:unnamed protein product, partial [Ectocarpus sp. 12 AP-2014]
KAWTTKAKNCIQSMQTGRVMSAAHLLSLLEEASSIKVNLSPEVDSLRQAVKDLCEWRADYEHILRPLGLCSGLPPL